MAQKVTLDFSWKYQLMQEGCMLIVNVCDGVQNGVCCLPVLGRCFTFGRTPFFPGMSIKYSNSAHGVNHKATQSD